MDKDAYYFPHFSNARSDRKIRRLRKELGIEGYGIFFMLLEILRDQATYEYPYQDIDLLAEEMGTSEAKVEVVINKYNLFIVNPDGMFSSPKLYEYMMPYLTMKEQRRQAGIKSGEARRRAKELNGRSTDAQRLLNGGEQRKVKESKVKKSKKKNKTVIDFSEILNTEEPKLKEALINYIEYRISENKAIKSEAALNTLIKKVKKLNNPIDAIENTIAHGWQGIFENNSNKKPVEKEFKNPYKVVD